MAKNCPCGIGKLVVGRSAPSRSGLNHPDEALLTFGKFKVKPMDDGWMLNDLAEKLKQQQTVKESLLTDLKSCSIRKDLQWGKLIHAKAMESRYDSDKYVATALVRMYAKCGCMVGARRMFDRIRKPDVVSWNVLLLGHAENGDGLTALDLFSKMKACGCAPDSVTYVAALKACMSMASGSERSECLKRGREIHLEIGCHLNDFVQNTLVDMYAKCGSMVDARQLFDSIQMPDVVCWTALILGYVENGAGLAALKLFSRMKACGCKPDSVTYVAALKACTFMVVNGDSGIEDCLKWGREIHREIGHHFDRYVQSALIDLYAKCRSMEDARQVFDSIRKPDVVCWNALLLGYAENGDGLATLKYFSRMKTHLESVPNSVTYVGALKACGLIGSLSQGRKFHSEISEFTALVVTCLVDFYAKCGSMIEACEVFERHSRERIVPTWNALLTGYGSFGDTESVFNLFEGMRDQGFQPDAVTFVCMLTCCSHAGLVEKAREYLKAMPVQYGITPTVMHYTCMVDALGRADQMNEAIDVLRQMPCSPNIVTWTTLLSACRKWKNVEVGRWAFQSLVNADTKTGYAHADAPSSAVQESIVKCGAGKLSEQAYVTDDVGNMIKFVVGGNDPPDVKDKLEQLEGMKDRESYTVSWEVSDARVSCGHTEKRAVVYGILRTGARVRVFKNTRMCDDCHGSTKMISKLFERVIVVRDAHRFHVIENGSCSCGDYW